MANELILWVDEEHVLERQVIDVATGEIRQDSTLAGEYCHSLSVSYTPMSPAVKQHILYERKAKNGDKVPVTVGDLGPLLLCKVINGSVVNNYSVQDLGKPIRLSPETLHGLATIFGNRSSKSKK